MENVRDQAVPRPAAIRLALSACPMSLSRGLSLGCPSARRARPLRLVELGLTVKTPARRASKLGRKLRAQELATKTIEKIIDPSAPPAERAQRRRRLNKGPSEFREDRVDLPKAKGSPK